jgi:hypothetical protein
LGFGLRSAKQGEQGLYMRVEGTNRTYIVSYFPIDQTGWMGLFLPAFPILFRSFFHKKEKHSLKSLDLRCLFRFTGLSAYGLLAGTTRNERANL